ncbi:MAG: hypothetical protein LBH46_03175 [Rickettsiales bacterium]|jgi:hypothetical protein|nr:hypothetical protein [Rickettsiales bacterium]
MKIVFENSVKFNNTDFVALATNNENDLLKEVESADAIILDKFKITDETLKSIRKKVFAIVSPSNNIDLDLATSYGIALFKNSDDLVNFLKFGNTANSLNYPEIAIGARKNSIRLLHTHDNVPGVMKELNLIFAYYRINIEAQYLNTLTNLGYVATDIAKESFIDNVVEAMNAVHGSKKVRVIDAFSE